MPIVSCGDERYDFPPAHWKRSYKKGVVVIAMRYVGRMASCRYKENGSGYQGDETAYAIDGRDNIRFGRAVIASMVSGIRPCGVLSELQPLENRLRY